MAITRMEGDGAVITVAAHDGAPVAVRIGRWRIADGVLTFDVATVDAFWSLSPRGFFRPRGFRRIWSVAGDLTSGQVDITAYMEASTD